MNNIDLSKLKEYSKDDIHEMIINGEIDHDFICKYISKRDKVYNMLIDKVNELQEENNRLKNIESSLIFIKNRVKQGMTQENVNKCAIDFVNGYLKGVRHD